MLTEFLGTLCYELIVRRSRCEFLDTHRVGLEVDAEDGAGLGG